MFGIASGLIVRSHNPSALQFLRMVQEGIEPPRPVRPGQVTLNRNPNSHFSLADLTHQAFFAQTWRIHVGMRLLPEEERLETLAILERNRRDVEKALQVCV